MRAVQNGFSPRRAQLVVVAASETQAKAEQTAAGQKGDETYEASSLELYKVYVFGFVLARIA